MKLHGVVVPGDAETEFGLHHLALEGGNDGDTSPETNRDMLDQNREVVWLPTTTPLNPKGVER